MSFWKYLGEFALFNMIYNWFSGKPEHSSQPLRQNDDYRHDAVYDSYPDESEWEMEEKQYLHDDLIYDDFQDGPDDVLDDFDYTDPDDDW